MHGHLFQWPAFTAHVVILSYVLGHNSTKFSMIFLSTLQVTMEFGLDKRAQTLQGLAFPIQEEAKRALQQLKHKRINYIQLVRKPWRSITQCVKCNKLLVKTQPAVRIYFQNKLCFNVCQWIAVKLAVRDLTLEQSLFVCVYVSQRLDVEKETIELVHTKPTETHELPYRIPTDSPRYHFFIFKHSHQGQLQEALGQYRGSL